MNLPVGSALLALLISVPFSISAYTAVVTVHPSGDPSGYSDHQNLQNALESLEPGGKVVLAPGHFYIDAGVVVDGFNGTLQGSSKGKELLTTVEAVAPFHFTHETKYSPGDLVLPSMFFFEFPEGEIAVLDLILQAVEPAYVEPRAPYGTALNHFIADFGGDVDVTYKNLRLIAGAGDYYGSNVAIGIHSMRGPGCDAPCERGFDPGLHGIGNAVFSEIESSNVEDYVVAPMWYRDGTVKISGVNSQSTVAAWGMINMDVNISDAHVAESWRALWLGYASGGSMRVRGMWATGGSCPAIALFQTENVDIRDSLITGCNGFDQWWAMAILLSANNRNVTIVDNAIDGVTGVPAAIGAFSGRGNSDIVVRDNFYDPLYFTGPPGAWAVILGSDDSLVAEPDLTADQVLDLGTNNTLKLGGD